ncbi:GNAT family N-acetyltransferase [Lactobacillus sp. ESL0785]|uniref:GNAT family N-acetyltransferase n=1 Tax=Lactobacillus sp. ESL0785 TaxID=2983232 RepID=UPI0023F78338|nr:GNAT family N-acetyltransferase [Lactobacillus sp. ESL0785]WEV71046.1 GNAT family N-acetyltransferase [Lactobacillus sp. ESL0785]
MVEKEKFVFKKIDEMSGREVFCIARLRINTFVTEQEITVPELDDEDLTAIQVYLLNEEQTMAQAVCRVFQEDGKWMLGRVAVAKAARGQHLGTDMMKQVHEYLQQQGADRLYCHAQWQAKPFYDSLGYKTQGEPFVEADVKHIMMYYDL